MPKLKSSGFWVRFGSLLGVLGVLCGALAWQWRNFKWKAPAFNSPRQQMLMTPAAAYLDQVSDQGLQTARAKSAEITALRQERAKTDRYPTLGVPVIKAASTRRTFHETSSRFRLRELKAYQDLTTDSPDARAAGERFLQSYLQQAAEYEVKDPDYVQLDQLGQAALEAGSRDPIVRTYHAFSRRMATADAVDSIKTWVEVIDELPQTKYPRKIELYARTFLRDAIGNDQRNQSLQKYRQIPVPNIVQSLEEDGVGSEWLDCIVERLWTTWDAAPLKDREELLKACLQSKSIDPYIGHLFAGVHYTDVAWRHRGNGTINNVSNTQYQQFRNYATRSAEHLQYAWLLHPELPYAPRSLITLAMAGEGTREKPYFWYLRSIEARFDHYGAYTSLMSSLLPRWGGSHSQMLTFARNCIGTERFDTTVPYVVLDVLKELRNSENENLVDHPDAIQLLRDLCAKRNAYRASHPETRLYEDGGAYRADLVTLLEECELLDLAAAEYRLAGDNINWTSLRRGFHPARYLAARLIAAQREGEKYVIPFDVRLRQNWEPDTESDQLTALSHELQELQSHAPADDAYFAHAAVILEQRRQFSSAEWIDVRFDKELHGWEPYCDHWSVDDDGRIQLSSRYSDAKQLNLRPMANFQPPLEVEVTIEMLDPAPYPTGLGIGWCREGTAEELRSVRLPKFAIDSVPWLKQPRRDLFNISGVSQSAGRYPLKSIGAHRITLKQWPELAEVRVDNTVWSTLPLDNEWNQGSILCFGTNLQSGVEGSVRLSQIRIRKLNEPPPPRESEPLEDRLKYWEVRHAANGDDLIAQAHLCRLRFEQGRFEDVVSLVDRLTETHPGINDVQVWKARAILIGRHDEAGALAILRECSGGDLRDDPEVLSTLAELQAMTNDASSRNGRIALNVARMALNSQQLKHPRALAALAAAQAEMGDFSGAIGSIKMAMALGSDSEKIAWQPRLAAYEAETCYRYPTRETELPAKP
ncbi:MAG: hypothetical protein JSS49_21190 [Planctomycetes bacterium]|nr:hypothetical protein [Planctomycetota bacterium]